MVNPGTKDTPAEEAARAFTEALRRLNQSPSPEVDSYIADWESFPFRLTPKPKK